MFLASGRTRWTVYLVAGAFFMENLDVNVIAPSLPAMGQSFGVPAVDLNIGMSAYVMTIAAFIPASSWISDRIGARNVFAAAIAVFTFASVMGAMAEGIWTFVAARVLQGIGGAMMVPVGRLVVMRNTEKSEVMKAVAYIVWPGLVAPILGPPIGGFLTTYFTWRLVFLMNVPLGLLGFAMALALVPNDKGPERPFDAAGFGLFVLALVPLLYGLELLGREPTPWAETLSILILGVVASVVALRHFRRAAHPVLDLSILSIPAFAGTAIGGSLFRIAFNAVPFLMPLMLQLGLGMSAFESGLLVLCLFAGNLLIKPATTPILRRFGFRGVMLGNGLVGVGSFIACAAITHSMPVALMCLILLIGGMTRSMQYTVITTMGFADIPSDKMGNANMFASMLQQANAALGVTCGALVLRIAALMQHGVTVAEPTTATFRIAFLLIGLLAVAGVVNTLRLPADAGAEVTGHRQPR
ncbi:MAG TPA: MFS transporter [Stellaceae bacterium]|jgi:EmrB/QacA subfamily drug resistance transporter|nr:MFS transporter [Stellaceae bacterium]